MMKVAVRQGRRSGLASHERQRREMEAQPERYAVGSLWKPWWSGGRGLNDRAYEQEKRKGISKRNAKPVAAAAERRVFVEKREQGSRGPVLGDAVDSGEG